MTVAPEPLRAATPGIWTLAAADDGGAQAGFAVRKLGLITVRGRVPVDEVTLEVDAEGLPVSVQARLRATDLDTSNPKRDQHLRTADFFDTENHPEWTFTSVRISAGSAADEWLVDGDLTIRTTTSPVALRIRTTHGTDGTVAVQASGEVDRFTAGIAKLPTLVIGRSAALDISVTLGHAGDAESK